jgi:hypothetical protein
MPEVRHGFGGGEHTIRPVALHGKEPYAPLHHGGHHGRDNGSGHDDALRLAAIRSRMQLLSDTAVHTGSAIGFLRLKLLIRQIRQTQSAINLKLSPPKRAKYNAGIVLLD